MKFILGVLFTLVIVAVLAISSGVIDMETIVTYTRSTKESPIVLDREAVQKEVQKQTDAAMSKVDEITKDAEERLKKSGG